MHTEITSALVGEKYNRWQSLMNRVGLQADSDWEQLVLVWDDTELVAAGARRENVLKCLAVDPARQGEGLLATVISALRKLAFEAGEQHLFLYTKPANRFMFSDLLFYPVVQTDSVLLMEDRKDGIRCFLESFPKPKTEHNGAIVMNCNPFTKGHRYLIETAAGECDHLYVFVLSEDKSRFSADDRIEMVRRGTADLKNVSVFPTGSYLISSATFPTYFLKETANVSEVQCRVDAAVFSTYFAQYFSIKTRYVGTEPCCTVTRQYNEILKDLLPKHDIAVREIPRLEQAGVPVSASVVRSLLDGNETDAARALLPQSTIEFLNL